MVFFNTKLKYSHIASYIFFLLTFFTIGFSSPNKLKRDDNMSSFFAKESVRILVTDSGLGGLSVLAEIENLLRKYKSFKNVELIFVNSLLRSDYKFNSMKDETEKIKVFDYILSQIYSQFNPDIILIACNTLSVITTKTNFFKDAKIPVIDIVDFGVNMILKKCEQKYSCDILILGTETTINSNNHKEKLIKNGINEKLIYTQGIPNLESEIQMNPESDMVLNLIDFYFDEVKENRKENKNGLLIALCCSHYGYSLNSFEKIAREKFGKGTYVLNPNSEMAKSIIYKKNINKYKNISISVAVFSQAELSEQEIDSISKELQKKSLLTSKALNSYINRKDLFLIEK